MIEKLIEFLRNIKKQQNKKRWEKIYKILPRLPHISLFDENYSKIGCTAYFSSIDEASLFSKMHRKNNIEDDFCSGDLGNLWD